MKIDRNILIRRSVTTATAFVLSVCLMFSAIIVTALVACDTKYLSLSEEKSRYAEMSLETLKTELQDLTIPGGFPLDFFDSRIDEELYKQRVAESFTASATGTSLSYGIASVKEEFYDIVSSYVLIEDGEIVPEIEEGLWGLADECAKCYVKYSNPSSVKLVAKYFPSAKRMLLIASGAVAILLIASAVFLVYLCKGKDLLKHLIFSFGGAALLSGVLPTVLLFTKEITKVSLTLPALYSFVVTFVEGVLSLLALLAGLFLLVTVVLGTIKLILFKRKKTTE